MKKILAFLSFFVICNTTNLYCVNQADTISYDETKQEYYYSFIDNNFNSANEEKLKQFYKDKFQLSNILKEEEKNLSLIGSLPFNYEVSLGFGADVNYQWEINFLLNLSFKEGRYRLYINHIVIIDHFHGDSKWPLESYFKNQTEMGKVGNGLSKKKVLQLLQEMNLSIKRGIYKAFDDMRDESILYLESSVSDDNW